MDNAFELASHTPISRVELQRADSRRFAGRLFTRYVQRDPAVAPAAVAAALAEVDTLEDQVRAIGAQPARLFTLAHLFRATLKRAQPTDVPGHGTVGDVGVADGSLGVRDNLLVEGVLVVAGDLTVGGQVIVEPTGVVIVTGSLHTSALSGAGQIAVGGDLRTMFAEVRGAQGSLEVSGELDAFLLIQDEQPVRAGAYSVGLHAVYPRGGAAAEVFRPELLVDGRPDWAAVAKAAQAGREIFVEGYRSPDPAAQSLVERL